MPRRSRNRGLALVAWASLSLLAAAAMAEPLALGDPLPAPSLRDQHDRPVSLSAETRLVLFAAE